MRFFSGDITEEVANSKEFQTKMEEFSRRTGIVLFPSFTPAEKSISMNTPNILEADLRVISSSYNFDYLPDEDIMDSLLYPIFINRWHTSPTHYTKRSGWKNYELIYTHFGSGVLNMDDQIYTLEPDSLCILDCRPYHYYFANDDRGWEYSFIHFDGITAQYLHQQISKSGILFTGLKNTEIRQKYDRIITLAKNNPSNFDLLFHRQLTSLMVELACSRAVQPATIIPSWLSQVQSYMMENYNKDWNVKDLAKRSYLSESRFAHVFKESFGTSPMEYRDYLRIEHAKDFLRNTTFSIEKIADLTGFKTMSGFYAAFSRHTGLTPGKYRKQDIL